MDHPVSPPARTGAALRRLALCLLAGGAASLGGCSSEKKVEELSRRIDAVEAKADAAEKRAKAAEEYVSRSDQTAPPEVQPQNELDPGADPAEAPDVEGADAAPVAPPPPGGTG